MDGEQPIAAVEQLLAEKGEHLLRTAIILAGSRPEGEDLLQSALEREGHHHHKKQRRRATRALMAAIPAVALVAGGAAIAAHGTAATSPATTHRAVLTAAYVTKQVEVALSSDNYVVEATGNAFTDLDPSGRVVMFGESPDGRSLTTWTDLVTGNSEGLAKLSATDTQTMWATGKPPNVRYVTVDTASKQVVYHASGRALAMQHYLSPSQLKQSLAASQVTIAGKSVINGQCVIDLRLLQNFDNSPVGVDFWVNAQTFQVVKLVDTLPPLGGKAAMTGTTYYHWLPRTKSLVAQVNTPQVPAGYRQVSASSK